MGIQQVGICWVNQDDDNDGDDGDDKGKGCTSQLHKQGFPLSHPEDVIQGHYNYHQFDHNYHHYDQKEYDNHEYYSCDHHNHHSLRIEISIEIFDRGQESGENL